jgi:uncharacterized protein (TIGR02145 family)
LDILPSDNSNLKVYPNPTREHANLSFNLPSSQNVVINVYNISGQLLLREAHSLLSGKHQFRVNFPVSGLYHVSVSTYKNLLNSKVLYLGDKTGFTEVNYFGSDFYDITKVQSKSVNSGLDNSTLEYKPGDVIHYTVYSGENITLISDTPSESTGIYVEFYKCADPEGKNYKIVQIGDQTWMAENLAYLPAVSPSSQGSETSHYFYVYGYQGTDVALAKATVNYKTYGVLYNWPAAMAGEASSSADPSGVQGVCPTGWHLPSDAEWKRMEMALGMTQSQADNTRWRGTQGIQLKATFGWDSNGNGTNSSGFSALPGGYRLVENGTFFNAGSYGVWWSSTEDDSSVAWNRRLFNRDAIVVRINYLKALGFNVRCVRDDFTPASLPIVSTSDITGINQATAIGGGNVIADGRETVTAYGICWSSSPYPTTDNSKTIDGYGIGSFTSILTGLMANTTYYVRAYATNSVGTAYGDQIEFKTTDANEPVTGSFTDPRDNKTYNTVIIGDQIWMAENLAYLPSVSPSSQGSDSTPFYYVNGYQGTDVGAAKATNNYKTYGVLYNWPAVMTGAASSSSNPSGIQGVCPAGWHLPSDAEWKQLEMALGMDQTKADSYGWRGTYQGILLKAISGWDSKGNGANTSGFSALPGGGRGYSDGTFGSVGFGGIWWTSTEEYSSYAWYRSLSAAGNDVGRYSFHKANGYSVRCVRD